MTCCSALAALRDSIADTRALITDASAVCQADTPADEYMRALLVGATLAVDRIADAARALN